MFAKLFKAKTAAVTPPMAARYNDFRVNVKNYPLIGVHAVDVEDGALKIAIAIPENDPFGDAIKGKFFKGQTIEVEVLRRDGSISGSKTYEILSKSFEGGNYFTVTSPLHRLLQVVCEVKQVGASYHGSGGTISSSY